eukprot:CAMPEP_0183701992 /NCGR_PEP_ID=MMETSP0737-20130205/221_1 /TAXON_ID=385413 /ORGANISM="Thalassiosira miniscula, Strain CCMP1093" /LENGTH=139 /DNA_ID=CAMNT_0025928517 /DNA_START=402 /DNA_END=821 /DNA_ORIENTATION=+
MGKETFVRDKLHVNIGIIGGNADIKSMLAPSLAREEAGRDGERTVKVVFPLGALLQRRRQAGICLHAAGGIRRYWRGYIHQRSRRIPLRATRTGTFMIMRVRLRVIWKIAGEEYPVLLPTVTSWIEMEKLTSERLLQPI